MKFLLATTELHKVPDTVVSRCQVLRLSPLTEEQIRSRLDEVFELEGIEAEEGVTAEIARRARGGMRDALSLADQLLALVGRTPRVADTARLAGEGSADAIEAMLDAILASDRPRLLAALRPPGRRGRLWTRLTTCAGRCCCASSARTRRARGAGEPESHEDDRARMAFGAERLEPSCRSSSTRASAWGPSTCGRTPG